jgi:antitoxin component of RelBE/YafQ-DinJ toxin-antitoxin module
MEKDMMEDNRKVGNITIRIDKKLLDDYKSLCERNGYDISKRLRLWIQKEIDFEKRGENIIHKLN